MDLTRRDAVRAGALGALAALSLDTAPVVAARRDGLRPIEIEPITFGSIAEELDALLRLESNAAGADSAVWFWWTTYVVSPGVAPTAIVGYEGIELSRCVRRRDGSRFINGHAMSFPRDARTGRFTDTAVNPVTGATVKVPVSSTAGTDPGYVISPEYGWWPIQAPKPEKVDLRTRWWREDGFGRMQRERRPPEGFPQPFIESGYYEFALADLRNAKLASIPYRTSGTYIYPYPKWLQMGDRPGHMVGIISGRKLRSLDELPREFRTRTETEYPGFLSLDAMFREIPQPS